MGHNSVRRRLGLMLWARRPKQAYFRWIFRPGPSSDRAALRTLAREGRVVVYRHVASALGPLLTREALWRRVCLPRQQVPRPAHLPTDLDELLAWAGLADDPGANRIAEVSEERVDAFVGQGDVVLSVDALDGGYDFERSLANLRAYLAPDGRFVVSFISRRTPSLARPEAISDVAFRAAARRHGLAIEDFRATVGPHDSAGANTVRLDYTGSAATDATARTTHVSTGAPIVRQPAFPFFVGCPRSGTTLTRALFDSHPRLAVPGESNFIVDLSLDRDRYATDDGFEREWFLADLLTHPRLRHWHLDETDLRREFAARAPATFADAVRVAFERYAAAQGKDRYGDKSPRYVHHMDRIGTLLPEARFVHIIRDGRDVALSMRNVGHERFTMAGAAWFWRENVRRGRRAGARLGPDRYLELRYEDLVDDAEATLQQACTFLELAYESAMLRYTERVGDLSRTLKLPEHHENLSRPPTRMRDWRDEMAPDDRALFLDVAGDTLAELGYDLAPR